MSEPIRIAELRAVVDQTLNRGDSGPWLPYEETWYEIVTAALALLDVAEAAYAVASHSPYVVDSGSHERLRDALARLNFDSERHTRVPEGDAP